jgi:hypothetical protein
MTHSCVDLRQYADRFRVFNEVGGRRAHKADDPWDLILLGWSGFVAPWGGDKLVACTNNLTTSRHRADPRAFPDLLCHFARGRRRAILARAKHRVALGHCYGTGNTSAPSIRPAPVCVNEKTGNCAGLDAAALGRTPTPNHSITQLCLCGSGWAVTGVRTPG